MSKRSSFSGLHPFLQHICAWQSLCGLYDPIIVRIVSLMVYLLHLFLDYLLLKSVPWLFLRWRRFRFMIELRDLMILRNDEFLRLANLVWCQSMIYIVPSQSWPLNTTVCLSCHSSWLLPLSLLLQGILNVHWRFPRTLVILSWQSKWWLVSVVIVWRTVVILDWSSCIILSI
jgi:hypothetical protein